jgi:uncharacterized protein (DUF433 family)
MLNLDLSPENQQFLDSAVARGVFSSQEAAVDRALDLLRLQQEALDLLRLQREAFDRFERLGAGLPAVPAVLEPRQRGVYVFRGHRISLHLLLEYYFGGEQDAERLHERFPSLDLDAVRQVVDYVRQHALLLSQYHEAGEACARIHRSESTARPGVAQLRERFRAIQGKSRS